MIWVSIRSHLPAIGGSLIREAGDIAAGVRQALGKALANRVGDI
jgi:hypothetical protein